MAAVGFSENQIFRIQWVRTLSNESTRTMTPATRATARDAPSAPRRPQRIGGPNQRRGGVHGSRGSPAECETQSQHREAQAKGGARQKPTANG